MKPSIPQGTRDFGASIVRKRNYIFDTIRSLFEVSGFEPLETPAMENTETLMGKYGEEGDRLIFRVLDSGNPFTPEFIKIFLEWIAAETPAQEPGPEGSLPLFPTDTGRIKSFFESETFKKKYLGRFKNELSGKALRYDLTIPFARYVAMNHGQLTFPFKRYQIQPVWRADRPQRGRYREFYQCDADIVGSPSLLNEVELVYLYARVFDKLRIRVEIKINSRKILAGLAERCGCPEKLTDITVSIDKLDKTGIEKVTAELRQKNFNGDQIGIIEKYLRISGSNQEKIQALKELFAGNETARTGITELETLLGYLPEAFPYASPELDFTLARGLNYYTGIIFEVKASNAAMGSIGGGGRYDDLTGLFQVPGIPGVGISFGVDRIYDVMEEHKLFPEQLERGTRVLFFNLGERESRTALGLMQQLRDRGISCEIFHEPAKFDKQFRYAEKKHIPYAIFIGTQELSDGTCTLKNLITGEQQTLLQTSINQFNF